MKIGIFVDTYTPQKDGVVTSVKMYRQELENQGHEVHLFVPKLAEIHDDPKRVYRFKNIPYPFQKEYRVVGPFSDNFQLKEFKNLNLDIIHIQTFFGLGILGKFLAKKYKIPMIFTYHTFYELYLHYLPMPIPKKWFNEVYTRQFCNRSDLVLAPTNVIRECLLNYKVVKPIRVQPSGIDPKCFEQSHPDKVKKFGLDSNKKLFVTAGRMGKEKGFDLLLKALAKYKQEDPEFICCFAGDGPEKKSLESLAISLGLSQHVRFLGYIDYSQILSLFSAATLFLFTSQTETQGLVIVEALGVGTPVIAVDALGPHDILDGNVGGILSPPDVDQFVTSMKTILSDDAVYQKKVEEAKRLAQSYFIEPLTKQLLMHYEECIETASRKKKR